MENQVSNPTKLPQENSLSRCRVESCHKCCTTVLNPKYLINFKISIDLLDFCFHNIEIFHKNIYTA